MGLSLSQLDPARGQRTREARALEHCACGGHEELCFTARQAGQGLDALARYLQVRLYFSEPFARRVQHRTLFQQHIEIGEPPFGIGERLGDHDDEPRGSETPGECGTQHCARRSRQASDRPPFTWNRERIRQARECREGFQGVENER